MGQVFPPLVYCFDGQIAEKEMFKRWSCLSHCLSLAADTVVSIVTFRSNSLFSTWFMGPHDSIDDE